MSKGRGVGKGNLSRAVAQANNKQSKQKSGARSVHGYYEELIRRCLREAATYEQFQELASPLLKLSPDKAATSDCSLVDKYCLMYFEDSDEKMFLGKIVSASINDVIVAFDDMELASFTKHEARCGLCYDNIIPQKYKDDIEDTISVMKHDGVVLTLRKGTVEEARMVFEERRRRRLILQR